MSRHNFNIPENLDGLRIDKALSLYCSGISRNQIQKAIKDQKLLLNGQIISSLSLRVKKNDNIDLLIEKAKEIRDSIDENNFTQEEFMDLIKKHGIYYKGEKKFDL